jgi:IS5 family transposase
MGRSGYGPQGYHPLSLFKALILQVWHSLSDPGLEEALRVRLDFMAFTGFESDIPDETTFCRFRGLLNEQGLWQKLLDEVNRQLQVRIPVKAVAYSGFIRALVPV